MGSQTTTTALTPRGSVPYWNMNLPTSEHTDECPDFLQHVNEHDRVILETPDEEYKLLSWEEVKAVVKENRLQCFQRVPSSLRRYLAYNAQTRQTWGSILTFILSQKLNWEPPITPLGPTSDTNNDNNNPFNTTSDWAVRHNDWPYGIDSRIVHLVVWTKFTLAEDSSTGDLTPEARKLIDGFVKDKFEAECGVGMVTWFKNWAQLKSVRAVEHFHVLLFEPAEEFVRIVTEGDVPLGTR